MNTTLRRSALALGAIGMIALGAASPSQAAITLSIFSSDGGGPLVFSRNVDPPPIVNLFPVPPGGQPGDPIVVGSFTLNNFTLSQYFNPQTGPPYTGGTASQQQVALSRGTTGGDTETLTITATFTFDASETHLPGSSISAYGTLSSDVMNGAWTVTHAGTVENVSYTSGTPLSLTGPIPPEQSSQASSTIIAARTGEITVVQTITVTMGQGDSGNYQASTVIEVVPVPEPSTLISFALGVPFLGALALRRRRRP